MSCNNPRCNYGKVPVEEGAGLALCPECNPDWYAELERDELTTRNGLKCRVLDAKITQELRAQDRTEYRKRQARNINNKATKY